MNTSEASLSFCVTYLRKGSTPQEVAALVKEKFVGKELDIALEWLRGQYKSSKNTNK